MEKKSYYRLRKEKLKRTGYYVYVYLDPRKKGTYTYEDIHLEYEPFYVGKGYGNRIKVHLYEYSLKQNNQKNNKIKKIINEGLEPIRIKLFIELTEIEALEKEIEVIEKIGLNVLTNVTKGGRISYKYIKKHLNKTELSEADLQMLQESQISVNKNEHSALIKPVYEKIFQFLHKFATIQQSCLLLYLREREMEAILHICSIFPSCFKLQKLI
jgi:hypothetical protein